MDVISFTCSIVALWAEVSSIAHAVTKFPLLTYIWCSLGMCLQKQLGLDCFSFLVC